MPEYDLTEVKQLAAKLKVNYKSRIVSRDVSNLGYYLQDVANCICNLTPEEFKQTQNYDGYPFDEYICTHSVKCNDDGDPVIDELYVKFSLINGNLIIDLASFHLTRFKKGR